MRYTLFRMKNSNPVETPEATELYNTIDPLIPPGESWSTFSINWDVLFNNSEIIIIKPETDYNYVHSTCVEYSVCIKNKVEPDFDSRQLNIIKIVESTMLEGKMDWGSYNKVWGLTIDPDRNFIHTKLFSTAINVVTDEMIANSAKSDGSELSNIPSIPTTEINNFEPFEPTTEQKAMLDRLLQTKAENKE